MHILVVEDDRKIRELLSQGFKQVGYNTTTADNGLKALELVEVESFDLMVVDIMIPEIDGVTLVKKLRNKNSKIPVIFLTSKQSVDDRIEGFQAGADDYLGKPFSFSELLLRVQAVLRRSSQSNDSRRLAYGGLTMDLQSRSVVRDGIKIELHHKEFSLLEYFIRNPENVLSKTQILENVWAYDFSPQTNVVDVLVCRVRLKVDRDFPNKLIHTIRGAGYVLRAD